MPPTPDHQLGSDLRLRRPAGAANRQQLGGMLRDLVGGDDSLLPPLQHLIARPAFLALDPQASSLAERLLGRDQLLAELSDLYHPRVVERLRAFLDGYLDLGIADPAPAEAAPMIWGDGPAAPRPVPPGSGQPLAGFEPAATAADTATGPSFAAPGGGGLPSNPGAAASAPTAAASPAGPAPEPAVGSARARSGRPLPWILGLTVLAGLGVGIGSQLPVVCRPLGLCPARPSEAPAAANASSQSLDRAQQAASALERASRLETLEAALADLERELLRLSGDPLSQEQLRRREQLQATARGGRQRLSQERQQAQTVAQAAGRIDGLASLPAAQQATERQSLSQVLEAIPERSLAHDAARKQLERLRALPAAPAEAAASPATPGDPAASGTPATTPQSAPDPGWRSAPASQGSGQSSGSAPAAPQPAEESGSTAPHREDPLF